MTAFRLSLVIAALVLLADISNAQDAPLRDPIENIEGVLGANVHSPSDARWLHVEPIVESDGAQWHFSDTSADEEAHLNEWETPEFHELGEIAEAGEGCNCGKKHCPGVCRDPGHPAKPKFTKPGDRDRGDCPPLRYRMDDCQRAGNPHCVARWAKCSVDGKYSAWFSGGGAAFCCGRSRQSTEGTWGLDYNGYFGHANVWLKYTRGRNQGGEGAYRTDGEPKVVSRAHELLGLGH